MLRRHMLRYRMESVTLNLEDHQDISCHSIQGHRRILDCIKEKDRDGIGGAIRDHLDDTKTAIKKYAFKEK